MRRDIDAVEIKEPPLQELNKKRSCLKRSCMTGCGCIIIFLIACLVILKIASTPPTKELKQVPERITSNLPLYDEKNIEKITFTSGQERGQVIELAAYVPKLVLMPFILMLEKYQPAESASSTQAINWQAAIELFKEPVADHRDITNIEWKSLDASPRFIMDFYRGELQKRGYSITVTADTQNTRQFSFKKNDIEGAIYLKNIPGKEGTEYVLMTIQMPTANSK